MKPGLSDYNPIKELLFAIAVLMLTIGGCCAIVRSAAGAVEKYDTIGTPVLEEVVPVN